MKRYLLFSGRDYYPRGGWRDFQGAYEFVGLACAGVPKLPSYDAHEWAHVVDTETAVVVAWWEKGSEWRNTDPQSGP